MNYESTKCGCCGTEYPHGVTAQDDGTCDWCPGVVPQPVAKEQPAEVES